MVVGGFGYFLINNFILNFFFFILLTSKVNGIQKGDGS